MYNSNITNSQFVLIIIAGIFYLIPVMFCLVLTIIDMIRSMFRDLTISPWSEEYSEPMSIREFISSLLGSIIPILNLVLVLDFVSRYPIYKIVIDYIDSILDIKPHISYFKKSK